MKHKIDNVWIHMVRGTPYVTVWRDSRGEDGIKKHRDYNSKRNQATRLRRAQWMQQQLVVKEDENV